jgi:hypothetical protein
MNMMDMILSMADGNPGATNVVIQLISEGGSIDPDSAFGPIGAVLLLDTFGIYGSDIWVFYKDICREELINVFTYLRAIQLGITGSANLLTMIYKIQHGEHQQGIDFTDLYNKVKEQLPNFNKEGA